MQISTLQDVAAAVRGRRRSLSLTQASLARRAGVSRTFVSDLEAGKLTVQLRSVLAVVEALGCTLSLHGPGPQDPAIGGPNDLDLDRLLADYDTGLT